MSVLTESGLPSSRPARGGTVEVAGISWPVYKLHALAAGVIAALVTLVLTRDLQITAWASGSALVSVWWVERYFGNAATEPGENPPGIS
ncbi:hypothetical protein [Gordonia sp. NPDC003429]